MSEAGRVDRARVESWIRTVRRFEQRVFAVPYTTITLLVVLAGIHVLTGLVTPGRYSWWMRVVLARPEHVLVKLGARDGARVADGEWWRVVSYGFLHWDLAHIFLNGLALWGLGRAVEAVYGPVRFLWIFLVSIVGGGLLSQTAAPEVVSVGASGGVFGLLGALVVYGLRRRADLPPPLRRVFGVKLWPWIVLNLGIGLVVPFIDQRAHVGGLVAGALAALPLGDHLTDNHRPRPAVGAVMAVVMTILLAWSLGMVLARA